MRGHRLVLLLLAVWAAAAVLLAAAGVLTRVFPPVFAFGLTALALIALATVPPLRAWAQTVPLRPLVLYHTVRFVGLVFLVMASVGTLPPAWAVPAGWGDLAAAVLALAVAYLVLPIRSRGGWWAVLAWNVFGLLDIVSVLVGGIRLARTDVALLRPLTELPLALLPLFIVPLILVSHALIFWRLARRGGLV